MVKQVCVGVVFDWRKEINQSALYSVHVRIKQGIDTLYIKVPLAEKFAKINGSERITPG